MDEVLKDYAIVVLLLGLLKDLSRNITIEYFAILNILLIDGIQGMVDLILIQF
jgi:hypothetical protein